MDNQPRDARSWTYQVIATIRPDLTVREVATIAKVMVGMPVVGIIAAIQPSWTVRQVSEAAKAYKANQ